MYVCMYVCIYIYIYIYIYTAADKQGGGSAPLVIAVPTIIYIYREREIYNKLTIIIIILLIIMISIVVIVLTIIRPSV